MKDGIKQKYGGASPLGHEKEKKSNDFSSQVCLLVGHFL